MARTASYPFEAPEQSEPYSVTLHFQGGGSDKIYKVSIEPAGDLWVVNYANGRRGAALATGTKTSTPVAYDRARKICNATLAEKVGKGYQAISGTRLGEDVALEALAAVARESSGHVPQLLNPVDESLADDLVRDAAYLMQQKFDGERRILIADGGRARGGNRKAQLVALPPSVAKSLLSCGHDVVLDGEQVGETVHVWDLLSQDGKDLRGLPLQSRLEALASLSFSGEAIRIAETASSEAEKSAMLSNLKAANHEGVVFKLRDAPYVPGRPASGGTWHKHKFWRTLSAVVSAINAQRSVALELYSEDGSAVPVGNVTVPTNRNVPDPGSVVEVRYLYAYEGGSLFQPALLGVRSDVDREECLASQRVFQVRPDADETSTFRI